MKRDLELYRAQNKGNINVPRTYKEQDNLGSRVYSMRTRLILIKNEPERLKWLHERGFKMRLRNEEENERKWKEAFDGV